MGDLPRPVPQGVVETLQALMDSRGQLNFEMSFRVGDRVRLTAGSAGGATWYLRQACRFWPCTGASRHQGGRFRFRSEAGILWRPLRATLDLPKCFPQINIIFTPQSLPHSQNSLSQPASNHARIINSDWEVTICKCYSSEFLVFWHRQFWQSSGCFGECTMLHNGSVLIWSARVFA